MESTAVLTFFYQSKEQSNPDESYTITMLAYFFPMLSQLRNRTVSISLFVFPGAITIAKLS